MAISSLAEEVLINILCRLDALSKAYAAQASKALRLAVQQATIHPITVRSIVPPDVLAKLVRLMFARIDCYSTMKALRALFAELAPGKQASYVTELSVSPVSAPGATAATPASSAAAEQHNIIDMLIAAAGSRLESVQWSASMLSSPMAQQLLQGCRALRSAHLSVSGKHAATISSISSIATLRDLRLEQADEGEQLTLDIAALTEAQQLSALHLAGVCLHNTSSISNLRQLKAMSMTSSKCSSGSPISLTVLKALTDLTSLELRSITASNAACLSKLTCLRSLALQVAWRKPSSSQASSPLPPLQALRSLTSVDIQGLTSSIHVWAALSKLPRLSSAVLRSPIDSLTNELALAPHSLLSHLSFSNTRSDLRVLGIKQLSALTKLAFCAAQLPPEPDNYRYERHPQAKLPCWAAGLVCEQRLDQMAPQLRELDLACWDGSQLERLIGQHKSLTSLRVWCVSPGRPRPIDAFPAAGALARLNAGAMQVGSITFKVEVRMTCTSQRYLPASWLLCCYHISV